jgi:hypothetical protein
MQGYRAYTKRVRGFVDKLETLISVLESLTNTIKTNLDDILSVLNLLLR